MILEFIKTLWRDWPARMTGPLSLILLFIPIIAPQVTAKYLGGTTLVWLVCFLCLMVAAYRAWLLEHRARVAGKLDPLIEDTDLLRQLWDKIQYDHRESKLIQFPVFGFDVKEWEEVHKQLLRLFLLTSLQAQKTVLRFKELGITEQPRLAAVMCDQNSRTVNALQFTKLLEEHAALLTQQRQRLNGLISPS
jgi:hypothetical protein